MHKLIKLCVLLTAALVILLTPITAQELYRIVKVTGKSDTYLLYNRFARLIPDESTIYVLNTFKSNITEIDEQTLALYTKKDPVPYVKLDNKNPDTVHGYYLLRDRLINGKDLFSNITFLGNYINPVIIKFRQRLLMVTPLEFHLKTGIGSEKRYATNTIEFRWFNHSLFPYHTNYSFLGVENEIRQLHNELPGADPRVIVYNDSCFVIYFAYVLAGHEKQKCGLAQINYLEASKTLNITYTAQPIYDKHLFRNSRQKNWIPFVYKNETLLIQSINPFRVLRMINYGTHQISVDIVSESQGNYVPYLKSEPRGGTNVLNLGDYYLSFYHTKSILLTNPLYTYTFGAFTFSTEPPFRLLQMSITPIMPEQFYSGAWISRFIDYALYPVSCFMLDDADTIVLSIGVHDWFGVMGTISLSALLETLAPVNQSHDNSILQHEKHLKHHHSYHHSRVKGHHGADEERSQQVQP
jgi:predicted GH43/DUF377 family glycosyl hydrolase